MVINKTRIKKDTVAMTVVKMDCIMEKSNPEHIYSRRRSMLDHMGIVLLTVTTANKSSSYLCKVILGKAQTRAVNR